MPMPPQLGSARLIPASDLADLRRDAAECEGLLSRSAEGLEPVCWERHGETTRLISELKPGATGRGLLHGFRRERNGALVVSELGKQREPLEVLVHLFRTFFLPDGFPDSVASSYSPYMQWRAVQYFFGGAMSVFTTRSLLHSLGLSRANSTSAAVSVNWVLKDGAGRLGKMLYARHGRRFDSELKQMRLTSSVLMGLGAGLELATTTAPHLFLPLACAANVLKNVGAVTNTSTRAPIYKAFSRKENIGDITAKGESISNMADLIGTGFGILLARRNPSLPAAFWSLSLGFLLASYNEVRSVHLPTLNRARFAVAATKFLESGTVPGMEEVNRLERVISLPWASERPLEIGAKVSDAFESAQDFRAACEQCKGEKYVLSYRPRERKAYVVLREGAQGRDVIKGAFQAHLLLHHLMASGDSLKRRELPAESHTKRGLSPPRGAVGPTSPHERERLPWWSTGGDPAEGGGSPWGDGEEGEHVLWESAVEVPIGALRQKWRAGWLRVNARERARQHSLTQQDVAAAVAASRGAVTQLFGEFLDRASEKGWVVTQSLLNPGDARLLGRDRP